MNATDKLTVSFDREALQHLLWQLDEYEPDHRHAYAENSRGGYLFSFGPRAVGDGIVDPSLCTLGEFSQHKDDERHIR